MKLSIITPNYNTEKYIEDLFKSVSKSIAHASAFDEVEHIVVDDKSSDSSLMMIDEYAETAKHKVKVFKHEVNQGLGGARNSGFSIADGEYVWHVDSDDMISEDAIEIILNDIKSKKMLYKYDFNKFPVKTPKSRWHLLSMKNKKHFYAVAHWPMTSIWNSKFFKESGAKYLERNGDIGAFLAIEKLGEDDVNFSKKVIYYYRSVPNSMSKNKDKYSELMDYALANHLEVQKNIKNVKQRKYFESQIYHMGVEYILFSKKNKIDYKNNYKKLKKLNGRFRFYMLLKFLPIF